MREAFLQAIRANPADDGTRLVYADWLEDNGDREQAEFIRLQISLAAVPSFDVRHFCANLRLQEILTSDPEREDDLPPWARRVSETARYLSYRRGLPAVIRCDPEDWLRHGHELLERHPVEEVAFAWYKLRGHLHDWLTSSLPPRVGRYDLSGQHLTDRDVAQIADCPSLAGVTKLDLSHNSFGDEGAIALARSPHLASLRDLDLMVTNVGPSGFRAVTQSARLPNLRRLVLGHNHSTVGDRDVAELSGSPHRYEELVLYGTEITDAGVAALCAAPCVEGLRHLDLGANEITAAGARAIAGCAGLAGLEVLCLLNTHIGDDGASALACSPHLGSRLRYLNLLRCGIGPAGGVALARSPALANLVDLDLRFNAFGDDPLIALADAGHLGGLLDLGLKSTAVTSAGVAALARSPCLRRLIRLDLSTNQIDDAGAEALARSEYLAGLRLLILCANRIGERGAAALASSPIPGYLRILHLGDNEIGDAGARAFLDSPSLAPDCNLVLHGNPISDAAWGELESVLGDRFTLNYSDDLLSIPQHAPNPHAQQQPKR